MFPSLAQIVTSLERLEGLHPFFGYAFLGFKKADLPVNSTAHFQYSFIRDNILDPFFQIRGVSDSYFNPFKSNTRWVKRRYESTSLQRIVADTFGDAFIHEKGSSGWGWNEEYVHILRKLMNSTQSTRIPLLDLAVWLYRTDGDIPTEGASDYLVYRLCNDFRLTNLEVELLCNVRRGRNVDLQATRVGDDEILNVVGWPEGLAETSGIRMELLALVSTGPAALLEYNPSQRLNVIAGDNSLGKTFLFESAWWALTGNWIGYPAEPRQDVKLPPEIDYILSTTSGRKYNVVSTYNRVDAEWQRKDQQPNGLGLFATHSGTVALWDSTLNEGSIRAEGGTTTLFPRDAIWNGLITRDRWGRETHVCNGLIRDWVTWRGQRKQYDAVLRSFERSIRALSPPGMPPLRAGNPTKLPNDSREMPTLLMPYGKIPVVHASAGVQRILALAYMLVWHWHEHKARSEKLGREPLRQMVVFVDEIEAHLHPRWQRQIVPALLDVLRSFSEELHVQIHIATHSPLVLASVEPYFEYGEDKLHQLLLSESHVEIEEVNFFKRGSIDSWLESDLFGLGNARSSPAEIAIEDAKALQESEDPSWSEAQMVHARLLRLLPDDDPFWVRWNYFYERLNKSRGLD